MIGRWHGLSGGGVLIAETNDAKALYAWKHDEIADGKGIKHNWRNELIDSLKAAQKPDGSWSNTKSDRWFEGNPVLATSYAVLALQEARK